MKTNAGFWMRLLAFMIDLIIMFIINSVFFKIFNLIEDDSTTVLYSLTDTIKIYSSPLFILTAWLYFSILESNKNYQATLGKYVLKLKVVDHNNNKISFGKATGRYFAKYISSFLFFIGFLMIAFTKNKQGLHDKIAGTFVIVDNR